MCFTMENMASCTEIHSTCTYNLTQFFLSTKYYYSNARNYVGFQVHIPTVQFRICLRAVYSNNFIQTVAKINREAI